MTFVMCVAGDLTKFKFGRGRDVTAVCGHFSPHYLPLSNKAILTVYY